MTFKTTLAATTAVLALSAGSVFAQTASTTVQDNIDDLNEDIADDFDTTPDAFGNEGRPLGFSGDMALQANATAGNTDTANVGIGANLGFYDGRNGYDLALSYTYTEEDGEETENQLLYDAEYTRDFANPDFYFFTKLQGRIDSFEVDATPFETSDNFLGFGVGYRIFNTPTTQWSVQAGPGYRVAQLENLEDFEEGALSVSSNYYQLFNSQTAFTVETDIIASESDTVVFNDMGVNVNVTDTLALRTSLVTEYHTDPDDGLDDTDHTAGVSLIYSFN